MTPPTVPVSPTSASGHMTVTPFAARWNVEIVTDAIALTEPDWAKTVALPKEIAVTSPLANTVATAGFDELHVTLAPLIVEPFWSLTVADRWDVAPSEVKIRLVSERVTDVATGVGSVGLPSPPQLAKSSEDKPHATIFFIP